MKKNRLLLLTLACLTLTASSARASVSGTLIKTAPFAALACSAIGFFIYTKKKKSHKEDPQQYPTAPNLLTHVLGGAALGAGFALSGAATSWAASTAFSKLETYLGECLNSKLEEMKNRPYTTTWSTNGDSVTLTVVRKLDPGKSIIENPNDYCAHCKDQPKYEALACGDQLCFTCLFNTAKESTTPLCPLCQAQLRLYRPN